MAKSRHLQTARVNPFGKGDYIRRKDPETGEIEQICTSSIFNIDLSHGCIAQVSGGLLQEVYDNDGSYSPERTEAFRAAGEYPDMMCDYCYAIPNNMGNALPRQINEKTRASFEEHSPEVLRFGKLTEPGHPYYWEAMKGALELCAEYGTRPVIFTKMLPFGLEGAIEADDNSLGRNNHAIENIARINDMPFGENMALVFRALDTSLIYSLGWDNFERGPASQGFNNSWRINQAKKYFERGVNTSLTLVADVTISLEDNVAYGSSIRDALHARDENGINVRFIPVRYGKKKLVRMISGKEWDHIKLNTPPEQGQLLGIEEEGTYRATKRGNKELVPEVWHPDFEKFRDEGYGFCGQVGGIEYCDKCNLEEGVRIDFPASELSPLQRERREGYKKKRRK